MSLRIIAGNLGGRRIEALPGTATRPTRAAVREAWFSALGDRVHGSRVLDLFSGSGALGIEALSRGASSATFIESDRRSCRVLERNLSRLGIEARASVRCADALAYVESLVRARRREWDIVLADPPYGGAAAARLVEAFGAFAFAAVLCVEHAPGVVFTRPADWRRRYGASALSFYLDPKEGASGHA